MVRLVWTGLCGNKATIKTPQSPPFLAFAVLWKPFFFFINTTWGCHDSTWLGSIHGSYKHKPIAASPAACAQRTHSSQSGHHEEDWWGGDTHFNLKEFFSHSTAAVLKAQGGRLNLCVVYAPVSTRRSDKTDSVLTRWSGELMSPILGKMRAFLARTRKDLSVALFCGRGYELRGFDNVGGRFCIVVEVDFFFFFFFF